MNKVSATILGITILMVGLSQFCERPVPVTVSTPVIVTLDYAVSATVLLKVTTKDEITGHGSGVLIDSCGTILTARHMLDQADKVEVILADGKSHKACNFWTSESADIGFCRIDPNGPTPYLYFASFPVMLGDTIRVIGAPCMPTLAGNVTQGIVSHVGRDTSIGYLFQLDATGAPGNSGGPVLNMKNEIVGIMVAGIYPGGGINAAIPLEQIMGAYWDYLESNCGR